MKKKSIIYVALLALVFSLFVSKAMAWKRYDGVKLNWLVHTGHNAWIVHVHKEDVKRDLGIELIAVETKEDEVYAKAMTDWMTGGGRYDIATIVPPQNGDFMAGGYFIPIGEYIQEVDGGKEAYDDIIEQFRILCTQWNGEPYAFAQDGDVYNLYYRKDIMTDPGNQTEFKTKYGYDLPVPPKTMKELIDVAEFFNGWDWDNDGKTEYGYSQVWKIVQYRTFFPFFGAATGGKMVMDENLTPQIDNPAGAQVLNDMRKLLKLGPPGAREYIWSESTAAFINGEVALHWFWGDVAKMIYTPGWSGDPKEVGPHWKERIGYGLIPGYIVDGELESYNELSGKIIGVTKFCENPEAAVAALAYLSHPERNYKTVDSAQTGSDPFSYSQIRKSAEEWDVPIDQEYLDLIPILMAHGYPALYIPGGEEYYSALDTRIQRFLVDDTLKAEDVLAEIEKKWADITRKRGKEKQVAIWKSFLENCRKIGLKVY